MSSGNSNDELAIFDSAFIELKRASRTSHGECLQHSILSQSAARQMLAIKIMFDHQDYCIYEPTTKAMIRLRLLSDGSNADLEMPIIADVRVEAGFVPRSRPAGWNHRSLTEVVMTRV